MYVDQVGFLDKNNDALHSSLEQLMAISTDGFIKKLFPEVTSTPGVHTKKLALISVGSKFRVSSISLSLLNLILYVQSKLLQEAGKLVQELTPNTIFLRAYGRFPGSYGRCIGF